MLPHQIPPKSYTLNLKQCHVSENLGTAARNTTTFNTCLVCSVVVYGGHRNKQSYFFFSHGTREKNKTKPKMEDLFSRGKKIKQQRNSVDRFQDGVILLLRLYPSHQSLKEGNQTVYFLKIYVSYTYQTATFCQLSHLNVLSS